MVVPKLLPILAVIAGITPAAQGLFDQLRGWIPATAAVRPPPLPAIDSRDRFSQRGDIGPAFTLPTLDARGRFSDALGK